MRTRPLGTPRAALAAVMISSLPGCALFGGDSGEALAGERSGEATPPATAPTPTPPAATEAALGGLDPVMLCHGERFPGDPRLTVRHEGNDYRFVDADSQATFLVEPDRYAIQLGGACARMGALSGPGSAQRYLVHDGRIYTFASDRCRDGFAEAPGRCLFQPAPAPVGDAADGRVAALWQQAAAAHGTGWRTLRWATSRVADDMTVTTRTAIAGERALRIDTDYVQGDRVWRYANAIDGDDGWFLDNGTPRPMYAEPRRTMQRELHREPLVALRHGAGTRSLPGEAREVAGVAVTEVVLWYDGEVVAFGVDAAHHVRTARYRGRGVDLRYCEVIERFDDLTTHGGVLLPTTVHVFHDGVEQPELVQHRTGVQVDAGVPDGWFAAPGS